MKEKKSFNWRGWTSFVAIISFLVDTVSGVILYIAPAGRVANWTLWKMWGLTKDAWTAIHIIFSLILIIIIGVHLYFNWKVFLNYIWSKIKAAMNLKKELGLAVIVNLLIFIATLLYIPPFGSIVRFGEYITESWEESQINAPVAHAELLTLSEFAEQIQIPLDKIMSALRSSGYKIENEKQTLAEIAEKNDTSPNALYEALKSEGLESKAPATAEGTGFGKRTLEAVCAEYNISMDKALENLRKAGVEAKPEDQVKNIAVKINKTSEEILTIISAE